MRTLRFSYFLLLILISSSLLQAQGFSLDWVYKQHVALYTDDLSLALDPDKNLISIGLFGQTQDFDPSDSVFNLSSSFTEGSLYIQKLDTDGQLLWVKQFPDESNGLPENTIIKTGNVTTDNLGYIYVSANLYSGSTTVLDSIDYDLNDGVYNIYTEYSNTFILKLTPDGNLLWAKSFNNLGHEFYYDNHLSVDNNFNIIFSCKASIDDFEIISENDTTLISSSPNTSEKAITLKLDSDGNLLWYNQLEAQTFFDNANYSPSKFDEEGNVYIANNYKDTVSFKSGNDTILLYSEGQNDMFISKQAPNGELLWLKQFNNSGNLRILDLEVDLNENVIIHANFTDSLEYTIGVDTTYIYQQNGAYFIAKLNSSAEILWIEQSKPDVETTDIVCDDFGNVYFSASFSDSISYVNDSVSFSLYPDGNADKGNFIKKLNTDGQVVAACVFTAPEHVYFENTYKPFRTDQLEIDESSNLYMFGFGTYLVDFDPNTDTVNLPGYSDLQPHQYYGYMLKLNQCSTYSFDSVTNCDSFTWIDNKTYTSSTNSEYITLTNVQGCDSIVNLVLNIISVNDITVNNANNTLSANLDSASYQWLDCQNNFNPITGETSQDFTYTSNGTYAVEITENNCIDTSDCITISNVDLQEFGFSEVSVYPNPTKENCIFEFSEVQNQTDLKLFSALGQELKSYQIQNTMKFKLELNQPKGVYLVKLINETGEEINLKLVKN